MHTYTKSQARHILHIAPARNSQCTSGLEGGLQQPRQAPARIRQPLEQRGGDARAARAGPRDARGQ
jgi:hypothetical protein